MSFAVFRLTIAGMIGAIWTVGSPLPTHAQGPLTAATRHFEQAEFEEALDALADAERSDALDRRDYIDLLRLRATILFALDRNGWKRALRFVAAIDPDATLGPESPPPLHSEFERIRSASRSIELRATARPSSGGVVIAAEANGVPRGLETDAEVFGRVVGLEWRRGLETLVLSEARSAVEYYARLTGPGGSVLRASGSAAEPYRYLPPPRPERLSDEGRRAPDLSLSDNEDREDDGDTGWIWATAIGGVVVAAAAAVVISLALREPNTRVALPAPP